MMTEKTIDLKNADVSLQKRRQNENKKPKQEEIIPICIHIDSIV